MSAEYESLLKYKTKAGKYEEIKDNQPSPQGRQRVYFTCHPDDFDKYFDEVTNEILSKQPNCAIYFYDGKVPEDEEDKDLDLNQMILFVIPVTHKFICDDECQARKDFKYAEANSISMLLLQQEPGLEELFNQKCGNYQMLSKFISMQNSQFYDPTAITYDEKLTKYLESKILGDELIKEIQQAFDAYIFLSYRKKDRKYAQELMKLIHSNDFCRDIAIWYDEFLVSGEDFNEAIKEAMEKSKLFSMVVTPNLINEANYVQSVEYPAAKEAGKPVLPAEAVSTDAEKLKELYPDIPNTVDANGAEFSKELLNTIRKIAIKENDKDSKHNYLIGLAYLNGIDVEKNEEKGIELITSAAEAGLLEAMKKMYELASEYYRKRDLTGLKIIENLNNIYDNWESELCKKGVAILGDVLNDKAELLNLCGLFYIDDNPNKAEELINKAISRTFNIQVEGNSNVYQPKIAMKYANIALSYYNSGKYDKAEKYYLFAIKHIKPYVIAVYSVKNSCNDFSNMDSYEYELAYCYRNLARVYTKIKETKQAVKYYTEALNILHTITERTFNKKAEISTIHTCEEIGNLYRGIGLPDKAEEYNIEATSKIENLFVDIARSDYNIKYITLCNSLANIYIRKEKFSEAEVYCKKALKTLEDSIRIDDNKEHRFNICLVKTNLANIYSATDKLDLAEQYYLESINQLFVIEKEDNTNFDNHIALISTELGMLYYRTDNWKDAVKYLLISKDRYLSQNGNNKYDVTIAEICVVLGEIYVQNNNYGEANTYYNEALCIFERAFKGNLVPETVLADTESSIALTYLQTQKLKEAEEHYINALKIYFSQKNYIENLEILSDISRSCNGLGTVYFALKEYDEAERYYLKAFEIRYCLAGRNSNYIRQTKMTYENLIELYNSKKEYDKSEELKLAVENFETAMAFVEKHLK